MLFSNAVNVVVKITLPLEIRNYMLRKWKFGSIALLVEKKHYIRKRNNKKTSRLWSFFILTFDY